MPRPIKTSRSCTTFSKPFRVPSLARPLSHATRFTSYVLYQCKSNCQCNASSALPPFVRSFVFLFSMSGIQSMSRVQHVVASRKASYFKQFKLDSKLSPIWEIIVLYYCHLDAKDAAALQIDWAKKRELVELSRNVYKLIYYRYNMHIVNKSNSSKHCNEIKIT